jgi:dTDP-4-dehydrorhamnose 3,5-epimerase
MNYQKNSIYSLKKKIGDLLLLEHKCFPDNRGVFLELYRRKEFSKYIKGFKIEQISFSQSQKFVARGLHIQLSPKMGKIMRFVKGSAILFAFDATKINMKKKKIFKIKLNEYDNIMFWAPYYYARGFITLEKNTILEYLCTGSHNEKNEYSINLFDKSIKGSPTKKNKFIISKKDENAISANEWFKSKIFKKTFF